MYVKMSEEMTKEICREGEDDYLSQNLSVVKRSLHMENNPYFNHN